MTITVFGASGAIGKLLVKKALEDGYVVKAYVRNPSKLDFNHQNLEVIKGELQDYENIKKTISGVDVVISTLGAPVARNYEGFPVLEGHKNIIRAMKSENVKRFITIATPSVKFDKDVPSLVTKLPTIIAKIFLPKAYKEIVEIGKAVSSSDLDWTIVRFIAPNFIFLLPNVTFTCPFAVQSLGAINRTIFQSKSEDETAFPISTISLYALGKKIFAMIVGNFVTKDGTSLSNLTLGVAIVINLFTFSLFIALIIFLCPSSTGNPS